MKYFRTKLVTSFIYFIAFFIPSLAFFELNSFKIYTFSFILALFMNILNEILQELITLNSKIVLKSNDNQYLNTIPTGSAGKGYQPQYSNLNRNNPSRGGSGVNYAKNESN